MGKRPLWWDALSQSGAARHIDGLVPVRNYQPSGRPAEEVAIMEKAAEYGAEAVFFEAEQYGRRTSAQAFVYGESTFRDDNEFAEQHRKLWSWGGVPLAYRRKPGLLQLFRCAHRPDFLGDDRRLKCNPIRELNLAAQIELDPWWDEERIRSGTLWTDPQTCELLLSNRNGAHKSLFDEIKRLSTHLDNEKVLPKRLRRRLLILSLLIAYLEQRGVFSEGFFSTFLPGAQKFFEVLGNGPALVKLLAALEERFNGNVFALEESEIEKLSGSSQLVRFARMIEAREDQYSQLSLWELYSFRDLPIELISQIYQLFVQNEESSVYTPPFLVRFLVEEALSWETLDHITAHNQVVLDPACGSGVFLVEAYKRLVLHWRMRHDWKRPDKNVLQGLLAYVHGIDLEEDAVELAGFSLCLAMCDALQPEDIRRSIKLFPNLREQTLHHGCFFAAKEDGLLPQGIGVVLGNPPFASKLQTPATDRAYGRYQTQHGKLPDKQVGYLFLHEATEAMADGGTVSMLQQYNFLYNQNSLALRRGFLERYWVREILDFVSVRGLFQKGDADTKVVVVVAQKKPRPHNATLLHATFRRTGRIDAEQGLDLDYYDLHVVPYETALSNDRLWRANLLGGGRALSLSTRLAKERTLREFASQQKDWDVGEGFIVAKSVARKSASHLFGKSYLPSFALTDKGIDATQIKTLSEKMFRSAYTAARFTPPMLLVREQMDLPHALWEGDYLTYSQQMVGFCAPKDDLAKLQQIDRWMTIEKRTLKAYVALTSPRLFAQKATALQADDIYSIPYPDGRSFDLSDNERLVVDDIVDYHSDLIRLGESSPAMRKVNDSELDDFAQVLTEQINAVYGKPQYGLRGQFTWSGAVCHAYSFGDADVVWDGVEQLREHIATLLRQQSRQHLTITRMCRIYDGKFVYIVKPDRLRYWLRSVALRDGDEILADLRAQGY